MFLAADVTEEVSVAQTSVSESTQIATEEAKPVESREEAPHISTCLVDTEVTIGEAVTLEAFISGMLCT